jgi:hypothetical protein
MKLNFKTPTHTIHEFQLFTEGK